MRKIINLFSIGLLAVSLAFAFYPSSEVQADTCLSDCFNGKTGENRKGLGTCKWWSNECMRTANPIDIITVY